MGSLQTAASPVTHIFYAQWPVLAETLATEHGVAGMRRGLIVGAKAAVADECVEHLHFGRITLCV